MASNHGGLFLQASDNTRHLAKNSKTGQSYLVEPKDMKRVVLCSGAIYYHLSNARRQRKIRDIALVRLEQLAPFPHDLLIQVRFWSSDFNSVETFWDIIKKPPCHILQNTSAKI